MSKIFSARKRILLALLVVTILACISGGLGLFYERDLENNYSVWAVDTAEQACIVKKEKPDTNNASCIVGPMIFAYGWDEEYIIAKQYPQDGYFKVDKTKINWYVVDMKTDQVYGPMTENEYLEKRNDLKIPITLKFTQEIEPLP